MGLNKSNALLIAQRREIVSRLALRGMTQREIRLQLVKRKLTNPKTGEAWSLGTINTDIKALEKEWQQKASRKTDEMKVRLLAELDELKYAAWSTGDLKIVHHVLLDQLKLHGLLINEVRVNLQDELKKIGRTEDELVGGLEKVIATGA
jgi:hypothetical protein